MNTKDQKAMRRSGGNIDQSRALNDQISAMQRLLNCLEDEYQALQTRDVKGLESITEQKNACLVTAAARTKQLDLGSHRNVNGSAEIRAQREELDTLTKTCRDLNDANGALIRRQKMRIDSTLNILRGTENQASSYGPSGESTQANPSRTLLGLV